MVAKKPSMRHHFKNNSQIFRILLQSLGNLYARYTTCNFDFTVSHGGKSDATKHISSKKHINNEQCISKNQKLSFVVDTNEQHVINANCLFSAVLLKHHLPLSASDHAALLFKKMFSDSQIAKKYSCARMKTTAIVKKMANHSKTDIINLLKLTPFAIATDGSNNEEAKFYSIVATFFNSVTSEIENNLLCMSVLGSDSTGLNIAELIISKLQDYEIPMSNCLALSADNAPVMVGIKKGVAANLKKKINK